MQFPTLAPAVESINTGTEAAEEEKATAPAMAEPVAQQETQSEPPTTMDAVGESDPAVEEPSAQRPRKTGNRSTKLPVPGAG